MTRRKQQPKQSGCLGSLANVVAALLLLLALILGGVVCYVLVVPGADTVYNNFLQTISPSVEDIDVSQIEVKPGQPTLAPVAQLPTLTSTAEVPTLAPTWTPIPDEPSVTPVVFVTVGPSVTPSIVPTLPSRTPTPTHTPTPTDTPTATPPGPSPTPSPTRAQYLFTRSDDSPRYLENRAAGCRWLGIAGVVLDLNRRPATPGSYLVHIWDSGVDQRIAIGSAPVYGPSGWELFLFDSPTVRDYNVQLESPNGTVVSQVYRVQTRATCAENLLQIDFVQNH
ncbi:MAG TPA: hypothetical protein PLD25_15760 [Chloroflexota bacterium]|nr:hypothetical protein [Chloroflexota bacterium]HUM70146.1 hypothetical protein [Chloroflexota bacterium]